MFAENACRRREKKSKALSLGDKKNPFIDWSISSYSFPQNIWGDSDFGCQSIPCIGTLSNDSIGS